MSALIWVQLNAKCNLAALLINTVAVSVVTNKNRHVNERYIFMWLIKLRFSG